MPTLSALIDSFLHQERPDGILLAKEVVMAQAVAATRLYAGYADLVSEETEFSENTTLTNSEWALIRPLFMLYIERESAMYLEASHSLGIEQFGRGTAEVIGDIKQAEDDLPLKAFLCPAFTV